MKRQLLMVLLCALLLAAVGCGQTDEGQTMSFYYRVVDDQVYDTNDVIQPESRKVDPDLSLEQLLTLYLAGPESAQYTSPFPRDTAVESVQQTETCVEVVLSAEFSQLSGINRTIAEGCLTMTLDQLDGVETVEVYVSGEFTQTDGHAAADYVLADTGADDQEESIKLYFADSADRYLMSDLRSVVFSENETASVYVMQQLIAGPTDDQLQATMPEGTQLRSVTQENDLCTVDLSAEFRENMPRTEQAERMTVYSIVNSLTELEGIERVQILCEGQTLGIYRYLDLSQPLVRDENAIGPVLSGLNEFDATIYMRTWSNDYLAEVPLRIHQTANQSREELVIEALIAYEPVNGFSNPIPSDTKLISEEMSGGICRVTLSEEFLEGTDTVVDRRLRVMALVASLTALDNVDGVQLTVQKSTADDFPDFDLTQPIYRSEDWFFP
jgi:germination protein M